MSYKTLRVDMVEDVGIISFNRPDKLNALSMELLGELGKAVKEMEKQQTPVVILTGEGKGFSSGLDFYDFLKEIDEFKGEDLEEFLYQKVLFMQENINAIESSSQVYIAAIHGVCVGGGLDIAATCDIRIASRDAIFSIMETKVGVVPDLGSIQRLPRIIGEANTRLLAYTSRKISAEEAMRMGLINLLCDDRDSVVEEAIKLAKEIKANPNDAVRGTKKAFVYGLSHTLDDSFRFAARYNAKIFDFNKVKRQFLNNLGKGAKQADKI